VRVSWRDASSALRKIHGRFWIIAGGIKDVHVFLRLLAISYPLLQAEQKRVFSRPFLLFKG
jgi:hypothetical protein